MTPEKIKKKAGDGVIREDQIPAIKKWLEMPETNLTRTTRTLEVKDVLGNTIKLTKVFETEEMN